MKLAYFSEQTLPKISGRGNVKPTIVFNKSGYISINRPAMEQMQLKGGDKLTFAHDEDDPVNWYCFKDENGFALRCIDETKSTALIFNHKALQVKIAKAFEYDENLSRSFLIAGQPTNIKGSKSEYWGLIIKSII